MTTESIITLTPKAIIKVEDILAKEKSKTAMLRVVAMPSPGGSIQYMFAIEENPAENDKIFEFSDIYPVSGWETPAIQFKRVVLPLPEGPIILVTPFGISTEQFKEKVSNLFSILTFNNISFCFDLLTNLYSPYYL